MTLRKSLARLLPALALTAAAAAPASAQFGAAVGIRSVSGDEAIAANSDRRGYEFRAFWDGDITPTFGWRAEVAGVQMQFQRNDGTQRFQVSENGFEFSTVARATLQNGSLSGLYGLVGPTYSVRAICGASGLFSSTGRVACDEGDTQTFGYQVGAGFASRISQKRELLFEFRYLDGVIAGAGNPVIAISIGMRRN